MSRNRANKAELSKRREEIRALIVEGHKTKFIVDTISEKWKTSRRAVHEDIRVINKEWAGKARENSDMMRNKHQERLEWLFCEAAAKGHIKIALEVEKEIIKLNGLYNEKDDNQADKIPEFINIGRKSPLKVVDSES